ncbi:DUF4097 family beta strand repeat-containing protein [Oleiagrimonas soli]|uniref:DUF4097 domain-containing protein n=1 Tax=Oleiagrimonas soli TaxID=1543381 RepID=A0A099CXK9_9GAMM|nr:DUF4097 family beta strand repeat-containing protein [Oleiagrimonas soli]KGI78352.1 hypothetical protein LF63_0108605 [Oleiagrimonas soli]MBB6183147.1 hypothetical protein [Oleiagrimonas soli]
MGHPRLFSGLLAALVLSGAAAHALAAPAQTFTKKLERAVSVPTGSSLQVENLAGHVAIHAGQGAQAQITATVVAGGSDMAAARALADTIRLNVSTQSDTVLVHVDYPVQQHDRYHYIPTHPTDDQDRGIKVLGFHIGGGHSSSSFDYQDTRVKVYQGSDDGVPLHVDLDIALPAGAKVLVDNRVGRIDAEHLRNDLELKSASGDMAVTDLTGALKTHSGSGDMQIADVRGDIEAHTGSGDLQLNRIDGSTEVHTGSGDINGGHLGGRNVELHTGSGDVTLDQLGGDLKVETGSGDVKLSDLSKVTKVRVDAGSGDIGLSGDLSAMQDFTLRSGSGDITLKTGTPPAVRLDISGSDIDVDWSGLSHVESGRRSFRAEVGAGSGRGHISTGSGDVLLR